MPIKKKDFVEIEYTGSLKDEKLVFDTTDEKVAKDSNIHSERAVYGPIIICIGEKQVVPGLDEGLEGKDIGEHKLELKPEQAFGKKNAKFIQLVPTKKFFEQQINPMPGLQVNIDGAIGIVKTVSGGRTLVDFNHPLSGKEVVYDVKVKRIVTDKKEQVASIMSMLGMKTAEISVDASGSKAKIATKVVLPAPITDELKKKIKELVGVDAEFVKIEEKKEEPAKKEGAVVGEQERSQPVSERKRADLVEKKEEKKTTEANEAKAKEVTGAKGKEVGETNEKRAAEAAEKSITTPAQ
jgi:FKBP-type peptidyl-prolyl cis-trans isomerase 2